MTEQDYLKATGSRILRELNDLKRTPASAAKDLKMTLDEVHDIIRGVAPEKEVLAFIRRLEEVYPIDSAQLFLVRDDTNDGIIFVDSEASKRTARVYNRLNRAGSRTPYYEYRDTAMSKLAPFRPEWISQIRVVSDSDPYNPDVVLNNGHFMHQITLFVGPVNFYYEDLEGKVHCREMNTGDCNYITPFIKHSFTNRSSSEFAYIIACTLGGECARSQRELYALGPDAVDKYTLDCYTPASSTELIKQYMNNDFHTVQSFNSLLRSNGFKIDMGDVFDTNRRLSLDEYSQIAETLGVDVGDIMMRQYQPGEECIVEYMQDKTPHPFPDAKNPAYLICSLVRTPKLPLLRSSIITVLNEAASKPCYMERSLHTYLINFGNVKIKLKWQYNDTTFERILEPDASVYLKPFVRFALENESGEQEGKVLVVGASSSVNTQAQKELSSLGSPERVINELDLWYD